MRSNSEAHGPLAFRPVEFRPNVHKARAPRSVDVAWLCCGPTRGTLLPTPSADAWPHQHRDRSAARSLKLVAAMPTRGARPAHIALWSNGEHPRNTRRAVRSWRG